jgi:lipid-binding SYLF domain-containing protein
MKLVVLFSTFLSILCLLLPSFAQTPGKAAGKKSSNLDKAFSRANAAAGLFREIVEPPSSIPTYILGLTKAVAIVSSRANFGDFSGGEHAVGLVSARDPKTGKWTAPIFLTLKGGTLRDNLEYRPLADILKGKKIDIILLAMNDRTAEIFLNEEFVLGNDILVMPGTFGNIARPGEPVSAVSSGMIAYLYSSGAILGGSLFESSIKQDKDLNNAVYEEAKLSSFLPANKGMPQPVLAFTDTLNQYYSVVGGR